MYVPEKLKLNKFVLVDIPKPSVYFARLGGLRPSLPAGVYSGDEILPRGNKTDLLAMAESANLAQIRREAAEARDKAQAEEEN